MKKIICLIITLVFSSHSLAWAHPPSDVKLAFAPEENILKISMIHVSSNSRKHFIRKILVYKNGQEIEQHLFTMQTSAQGLTVDMPLEAESGDVISIKATCNQAGFAEASLVIP